MSASLIINARDRLSWHRRLVSDASTLLMWGIWLKLWVPVVTAVGWVAHLGFGNQPVVVRLVPDGSAFGVQRYAFALAGASGTLLIWNQLPAFKRRAPRVPSVSEYAEHFALPEQEILAGRDTSVCVVHHDESGRIVRVEARTSASA
jgi:poly-beta-1,6-N-acetyl-D-glucosamine biosynthesis protein PgaD